MLTVAEQVCWIPINEIRMDSVAEDAADDGSVLLRAEENGGYTLLRGASRVRALSRLGQACVDAVICPTADVSARVSALLSRILAGELHYLDEAQAYQELLADGNVSRQELALRLGRSVTTLQRKLRLLTLDAESRELLRSAQLCERYAQAILRIPSRIMRVRVLRQIVEHALNVHDAEVLIDETLARMPIPVPRERRLTPLMRDHRLYVNAIRGILEQMNDAGLEATMQSSVTPSHVELRITMPRFASKKR